MSREKFEVFQSQAYSRFVILASEPVPSAGAQVSYNVPREIFDKLVNYNILVRTSSNPQGEDYELNSSFSFTLSDEIINLIGQNYKNINNKFFIRVANSNGKPQLIKAAYKQKNSPEYNWFVKLYDKNGIGNFVVFEFDELNHTFVVDIEKNFETVKIYGDSDNNQEEINNLIKKLKEISKKYYELFNDDGIVYDALNKIEKTDVEILLNSHYDFDHCVNSDLSNKPANTLRHIILQKLKKSEELNDKSFNDIKKYIIDANEKQLSKYLSKPFKEWNIIKTSSDPFATNWKKIFRVVYPFFYILTDEKNVLDFESKLKNKIISDLNLIDIDTKVWGIEGINYSGQHNIFISFYPKAFKDARESYQLYLNFVNGVCNVGITKGSNCTGKYDISSIHEIECNNYDEILKSFFSLLSYFIEANNIASEKIVSKISAINNIFPTMMKRKNCVNDLNIILYGAPGTGKTYIAPVYALACIENKTISDYDSLKRKEILDKYNEYVNKGQIVFTTFHQSFGYEEFIQGLRPDTKSEDLKFVLKDGIFKNIVSSALNNPDNSFAIIIDEINRGNISKIFGELITLIEENKRWGEDEQMSVTLASGEPFTVPNNLYIIGTMNSADKSISLVDAALRRRFSFVEKCPESNLLLPEYKKFLDCVNTCLSSDMNMKDSLIGHSFFLNKSLQDSVDIINRHIIPLLYEYSFNNEDKVKSIIQQAIGYLSFTDSNGDHLKLQDVSNPFGRLRYEFIKEEH